MTSYSRNDVLSPLSPRGTRTFVFPNDNPFPASLWYHDHGQDVTGHNVYMGLAGFALLQPNGADLANPDAAENRLPSGYGRYDIPMVFQDRLFDASAQLVYDTFLHDGILGDRFCVNGVIQPYLPVARRKYRFRWLNGSNSRQYEFFLSTGDRFFAIGSDGGLLPRCAEVSSLRIAPAERYEVVIDFSQYEVGTKLYLQNCLTQTSGRGPEEINLSACTPIVEFRVERDEGPDPSMALDNGTVLAPEIQDYIDTFLTPRGGEPIRQLNFHRRRIDSLLRQRRTGRQRGGLGLGGGERSAAADRRQRTVGRVLQRADRRGAGLQAGSERNGDSGRHEHCASVAGTLATTVSGSMAAFGELPNGRRTSVRQDGLTMERKL